MVRRSALGRRGWLPYRSYLSIDRCGYWYQPAVKQWHWRRWTIWRNRRELDRQSEAAAARHRERFSRPPLDPAVLFTRPTDRDLEHARKFADEMGWV